MYHEIHIHTQAETKTEEKKNYFKETKKLTGEAWWHIWNSSSWEAEAEGLPLRTTWYPQWIPSQTGLQCTAVPTKTKTKQRKLGAGKTAEWVRGLAWQPKLSSWDSRAYWTASPILTYSYFFNSQVYMVFSLKENKIWMLKHKVSLYPRLTQTPRPKKRTALENILSKGLTS